MKLTKLAVVLLCICSTQFSWAQFAVTHDASWWNQQSDAYKLGYVTGYVAANITDHASCIDNPAWAKLVIVRPTGHELTDICEGAGVLWGSDEQLVIAQLNSFYKDSRNQNVIVELAITQVRDDINAKAKADYDHARNVERMRQVSDENKK